MSDLRTSMDSALAGRCVIDFKSGRVHPDGLPVDGHPQVPRSGHRGAAARPAARRRRATTSDSGDDGSAEPGPPAPSSASANLNGHRATTRELLIVRAGDVTPRSVRHLWRPYFPLGAVAIAAGPPGTGKSQMTSRIAADATRGLLPGDFQGDASAVVMVTAEDAIAETVVPRLMANDAVLQRVVFTGRVTDAGLADTLDLQLDLAELQRTVRHARARLLVIDPLVSFLDGVDAHKDQAVRRALSQLAAMAEEEQIAVLAVMHLNKRTGDFDALARLSGSVAFGALARSVVMVGRDRDAADVVHAVHVKSNLSRPGPSLRCRVEDATVAGDDEDIATSRFVIDGESDMRADDLLTAPPSADERTERDGARELIEQQLADGKRVRQPDLMAKGRELGFSEKTLRRAKKDLGVQSEQTREGWFWHLPDEPSAAPEKRRRSKS